MKAMAADFLFSAKMKGAGWHVLLQDLRQRQLGRELRPRRQLRRRERAADPALPKAQEVTFYYNDKSHHIADSTSYTFRADSELPVLSGSFGAVADPLMRDQMLDNLFQKTVPLKKGDYTVTVTMPGADALTQTVNVAKDGDVTFYYDSKARHLIADDGRIREDKVYHDSWSTSYRVPFEAVKEGTPVKLSLATGKGDVTSAKLVVYKAKITANGGDEYHPDYTAGTVTSYPMTKVSTSGAQHVGHLDGIVHAADVRPLRLQVRAQRHEGVQR